VLFTTANQKFSRLVHNANISRRDKWNYKFVRRSVFNHKSDKTFVLVSSNWTQFINTCWVDNRQQLFFAIIYLKKFVLAVVVALPSYMLKVPTIISHGGSAVGYYSISRCIAKSRIWVKYRKKSHYHVVQMLFSSLDNLNLRCNIYLNYTSLRLPYTVQGNDRGCLLNVQSIAFSVSRFRVSLRRGTHPQIFLGRGVTYFGTDFLRVYIWKRRVYLGGIVLTFESSNLRNGICLVYRAICDQYFCPRLCLYISVILERWLYKRCKGRKNFAKLKSLDRRKCYFQTSESHSVFFKLNWCINSVYMEHRNDADSNSVGNKHFITFQNVLIYLDTEWKQISLGPTFWTFLKIMGV
jgi:hypothetical protein